MATTVGDFNGDRRSDLVIGLSSGSRPVYFLSRGTGGTGFSAPTMLFDIPAQMFGLDRADV